MDWFTNACLLLPATRKLPPQSMLSLKLPWLMRLLLMSRALPLVEGFKVELSSISSREV
ncbi:hypothetical protein Tsubulata_024048 [Turnera subulata]|uniref:Uncharacterized protein n=1 Tax=Turnera subulata TaxID=218843 RepID=A0A9Q0G787_9ROSI|nr:hypothetical protein Tsubulata_024048 [Turnera subulata]